MSNPPITDAVAFLPLIFENLKSPPAADARNAPRITPRLRTVVESAKIDDSNAAAFAPCQYPQLATSTPKNCATFDPHKAKADVMPHGVPRVISVKALRSANTAAAANNGHEPRKIRLQPFVEGFGAIFGGRFFFSTTSVIQAIKLNNAIDNIQAPP